jgi:hypothetical protein
MSQKKHARVTTMDFCGMRRRSIQLDFGNGDI